MLLVGVVAGVAAVWGLATLVAFHTGVHAEGGFLEQDIPFGNWPVALGTFDAGLSMVDLVGEVDEFLDLIDAVPVDGLCGFGGGKSLDVRAIGLDADVASHALRLGGEAGVVARVLDGMAFQALESQAGMGLVTEGQGLLDRRPGLEVLGGLWGLCADLSRQRRDSEDRYSRQEIESPIVHR